MRIIERWECCELKRASGWLLLYGRRKVGKTTLVKTCVKYDMYILVTQTLKALVGGELVALDKALGEAEAVLRRGGVVVIDEFQRLPPDYHDLVSTWPRSGILIAAGSGHGIVEKVLSRNSPLLGLLLPYKVDILAYEDVLASVEDPELSIIYRDPWVIPYVNSIEEFKAKLPQLVAVAKGLVGEIFSDEGREMTNVYWRTMLHVAEGYWKSSEIAGLLALRGGVASTSSILHKLTEMGILRAIPTLGREKYYTVRSPALSMILYAEAKYGISDVGQAEVELPLGREARFTVGEMLANYYGAVQHYSPREDIDVVLVKGRERMWAFEVKLGPFTRREAVEAATKLKRVAKRAGLVSLSETPPDVADASLGPGELLQMAKELARKTREKC